MPTGVMTVAYNGAGFAGFAKQPACRTVQGELEHALAVVHRREVPTVCAGRTDAGVHALGQQVSFELTDGEVAERSCERLRLSLNAITPDDIAVRDVRIEPGGFSARFDAKAREYRYRIVQGPVPPVFLGGFSWHRRGEQLDIDAMRDGASYLVGEHDFKTFCAAKSAQDKPTVRVIRSIELFEEDQMGEQCLVVRVVGDGFLHNMIRIIVGTLVEVGAHNRDAIWVAEALDACDRTKAGPTAPACGLTFWRVEY